MAKYYKYIHTGTIDHEEVWRDAFKLALSQLSLLFEEEIKKGNFVEVEKDDRGNWKEIKK